MLLLLDNWSAFKEHKSKLFCQSLVPIFNSDKLELIEKINLVKATNKKSLTILQSNLQEFDLERLRSKFCQFFLLCNLI